MDLALGYEEIKDLDLLAMLEPLLNRGFYIDRDTGLIRCEQRREWKTPWIHTNPCQKRRCSFFFTVLFQTLKVLPSFCTDCFKVVVRPRSFDELVKLLSLQEEMNLPSKCGLERRAQVHGPYGGYFYCNGEKHGREVHAQVREKVSERISPEVPVVLKRACTEMEAFFGPSNRWARSERDRRLESLACAWVDMPGASPPQPGIVKLHVYRTWMEAAWAAGDTSVLAHNHGEPLCAPVVTYHPDQASLSFDGESAPEPA